MTTRREFLELFATLGAGAVLVPGSVALAENVVKVSRTRLALGTMVKVTVVGDPTGAGAACDAALDAVSSIEDELSLFLPGSALCRLNRDGFLENPPPSLRDCLSHALKLSQASNGAFDPTVEPVLAVIRNAFAQHEAPPSAEALARALPLVDFRRVFMDDSGIRLPKGGAVTLNGVAKGYAMDKAREALVKHGATRTLMAASGDMAVGSTDFNIALRDPHHPEAALEHDGGPWRPPSGGVGSSGGYMNRFSRDGRWHHITDPRTGHSPTHFAGVVVHARTAMEADALSTTCFVLPEAQALALADSQGAALLAIRADGTQVRSGLAAAMKL